MKQVVQQGFECYTTFASIAESERVTIAFAIKKFEKDAGQRFVTIVSCEAGKSALVYCARRMER